MTTIGIVSPGAMGSALGRSWAAGGARVVASVAGRSERTRGLAEGLELLPSLRGVVAESDVVVSICPPAAASEVLDAVIGAGRPEGLVADLNATSPALVADLVARSRAAGWELLDGSISGGPPSPDSDPETRLYLSGARASELATLSSPGLRAHVVGAVPGPASALKMCTASVYKGTAALWTQALQTAHHHDVLDLVLDDLSDAFPGRVAGAARTIGTAVSKADRYVAEMEHIAATQEAAGASGELFAAMAAVYARLAGTALAELSPEEAADLDDLRSVLTRLASP